MEYPVKKYVNGMKLNSPAPTVKRSIAFLSVIGIAALSCLLKRKTEKCTKRQDGKDAGT